MEPRLNGNCVRLLLAEAVCRCQKSDTNEANLCGTTQQLFA